jgi:hypothetical protein
LGLGNEGFELKLSRAYIAGLGTTGVLIGSFLLLLTVGSALVAFRGVPGQATNGDLSSIELRQQSERAEQGDGALLAANDVLGGSEAGTQEGASGDVFGVRASGSEAAGRFLGSDGRGQGDALRPGSPTAPLGQRAPSSGGQTPAPTTGVLATPPVSSDDSSGTGSGLGGGSDPGSGSGSDTGSGSGTGSSSGSGSDTGTGTDSGSGSDSGSSSGSGSSSSGGTTSTDSGSGSSGSSGSGSGGTGTVTDTVEDTTDTAGSVVGTVSPAAGTAVSDAGTATGGLLDDVTSVVTGLGS